MAMEGLAKAVMTKVTRKYKPKVSIGVSVDTVSPPMLGPGGPRHDWRKEEMERLDAEIAALDKELAEFDPKSFAERGKKAIEIKLKLKKLRREEHQLKADSGGGYCSID